MLDEVIALIRASRTVEEARTGLIAMLDIDEVQARGHPRHAAAQACRPWSGRRSIDQHDEIEAEILDYQDILAKPGPAAHDRLRRARRDRQEVRRRPPHRRSCPSTGT
jgi:DNA gyrase/topoisomerase IV subunit A